MIGVQEACRPGSTGQAGGRRKTGQGACVPRSSHVYEFYVTQLLAAVPDSLRSVGPAKLVGVFVHALT